jgi:hypothetical protein
MSDIVQKPWGFCHTRLTADWRKESPMGESASRMIVNNVVELVIESLVRSAPTAEASEYRDILKILTVDGKIFHSAPRYYFYGQACGARSGTAFHSFGASSSRR